MYRKTIIVISLIFNLCFSVFAQDADSLKFEARIGVVSRVVNDTISLRWAPSEALAWEYANKYGYVVEKYTMVRNGKLLKTFDKKILTANPQKPLPVEEWEKEALQNQYAAIAAQSIYGETFELEEKTEDMYQLINKAKETENRFSFALFCADQSFKVAQMSGLSFIDTDVKANERYLYKIYSPVPHEMMAIDTGYIFIDASEYTRFTPPNELEAAFNGKSAFLTWNTLYDVGLYSGYIVERSDDACKSFKRLNEKAFINTSINDDSKQEMAFYMDTLPEFDKEYFYRVRGISPFGDIGTPSVTVNGKAFEKLKAKPFIESYNIIMNNKASLKWDFPEEFNKELKGFTIEKCKTAGGKYQKINMVNQEKNKRISTEFLSPDIREYLIEDLWDVNYIVVTAVDKNDAQYRSSPVLVQLEDNLPPMSPQGVKGEIDTSGMVMLHWNKNAEADLLGYRVFASNSNKTEFMQITTDVVKDTIFTTKINLKTLTKNIYYRVVASDFHGNHSEFSDILKLERPDIVAPEQAFFTSLSLSDSCIYLQWKNSASSDVAKLSINRKNTTDNKQETIALFTGDSLPVAYCDYTAQTGVEYEYSLITEDLAGNQTASEKNVEGKLIDRGMRDEISNLKVNADRQLKQIVLSWKYDHKDVYRYYIYRSLGEAPLGLYKTIDGDNPSFTDTNLKLNTTYTYRIRAEFENGSSSPFCKEVLVEY